MFLATSSPVTCAPYIISSGRASICFFNSAFLASISETGASNAANSASYLALIALTPATVMSPELYLSNSSCLLLSISVFSSETTGAVETACASF